MYFQLKAKRLQALLVATAIAAFGALPVNAADTPVEVLIDQVSLVKLDRPAAEIVVGNPSIADVSVQSGKVLVLTGKSFGETNLIVLDGDGKIIISKRLIVSEPRTGIVTIYRGTSRQTVNCSPYCTPPLAIGDDFELFRHDCQGDQRQAVDQPVFGRRHQAIGIRATRGVPALHLASWAVRVAIAQSGARSGLGRCPGRCWRAGRR